MADFKQALTLVLKNEGLYVNDPTDKGGETYRGISRANWPSWKGWVVIDIYKTYKGFPSNLEPIVQLQDMVAEFYKESFWDKLGLDDTEQASANCVFDFAVNGGTGAALELSRIVSTSKPFTDEDSFINAFTIAKIARYITICKKRPDNKKYFFGWISRALGDVK